MSRPPADRACAALLRALRPVVGPFSLVSTRSRDWASATFEGARHCIAIRLEGDDIAIRAMRLQRELGDAELEYAGGFVADILVTARLDGDGPVLAIEALTIDEPEKAETVDRERAGDQPRREAMRLSSSSASRSAGRMSRSGIVA